MGLMNEPHNGKAHILLLEQLIVLTLTSVPNMTQ